MFNWDSMMKEVLLSILRQQMDGCTRDQFWAVAAVSGLNGLILSKAGDLSGFVPIWTLTCAVLAAGFYAVYYIIHRHCSYYRYSADIAILLADEDSAPEWIKRARQPSEVATWLGSGFYVCWVTGATVLGLFVILKS